MNILLYGFLIVCACAAYASALPNPAEASQSDDIKGESLLTSENRYWGGGGWGGGGWGGRGWGGRGGWGGGRWGGGGWGGGGWGGGGWGGYRGYGR